MPITVELNDMHSYSPVYFIVIFSVVLISILAFAVVYILKNRTKKEPVVKKHVNPVSTKHKYIKMLGATEKDYHENKINNRSAYEQISKIVRCFVYEITGVKTHNFTLDEIRKINMPSLYAMINECYMPEFAFDNDGNVQESLMKARKVIEEWN